MKRADITIIGGSAAGLTAAITARRHYPTKSILLIRKEKQVPIPCGIPYIFGTLEGVEKNLIPDGILAKHEVELRIDEVTHIQPKQRVVICADGEEIAYDKLIVATGSVPATPPIPGIERKGVLSVRKEVPHLNAMAAYNQSVTDVVIVGGGFIGIEFADEMRKRGGEKRISIIECLPHCLSLAYDEEFCLRMEDHLRSRGLHLYTDTRVEEIVGEDKVEGVRLDTDENLPAQLVLLATGAIPLIGPAASCGLALTDSGAIEVDRHMRTSDEHIFACGDCAGKRSFFGGQPSTLMLASIATTEARIAAANLYGLVRENVGTVGVWSTAVGEIGLATAGLTEAMATRCGYRVATAVVNGPNRHPGCMPGAATTMVKLVFEHTSRVLLGGQVLGDHSAGEMINILSACVQSKMTAEAIAQFQLGTHPAMTASPIAYPIVNAAELALQQIHSQR